MGVKTEIQINLNQIYFTKGISSLFLGVERKRLIIKEKLIKRIKK